MSALDYAWPFHIEFTTKTGKHLSLAYRLGSGNDELAKKLKAKLCEKCHFLKPGAAASSRPRCICAEAKLQRFNIREERKRKPTADEAQKKKVQALELLLGERGVDSGGVICRHFVEGKCHAIYAGKKCKFAHPGAPGAVAFAYGA